MNLFMCREDHFDDAGHQENLPQLQKDWEGNQAGLPHAKMAFKPNFWKAPASGHGCPSLWDTAPEDQNTTQLRAEVDADAKQYKKSYEDDVQNIFSRVQHHWHATKDGAPVPGAYCRKKGLSRKKGKKKARHGHEEVCKQDFPKAHQLNLVPRVICPGVARKHRLNVKGRRNALCLILARRRCRWLSGTTPMMATVLRSNTHIAPNFRIPLMEETHDPECTRQCIGAGTSDKQLMTIAQKAMRQMTGYFSGYICKRQPVGRFQLRAAAKALPCMEGKLTAAKTVSNQMAQVVSRMFSTLEGRGKLCTAAEIYNLSANYHESSHCHAEYIATFQTNSFNGHDLLNRLEHEKETLTAAPYTLMQAKKRVTRDSCTDAVWYNFSDVYGFRPPLECLLYLCPWEFVMWWTVVELLPPTRDDNTLTRWIPPMSKERAQELELLNQILIPGTHYEVNASSEDLYRLVATFADSEHYAVYPSDASSPELQRFRSQWILRRRQRPVVPAPKGPMPHRGLTDSERRGMLCSLYFRPWVLLRSSATSRVVHLMNLDLVTLRRPDDPDYAQPMGRQRLRSKMQPPRWSQRSYKDAWTRYIRGNIVTDHAQRYIQNFLLVMAGTGKHEREDEEGQNTRRKREDMGNPGTKMDLEEMQQVLREAPRTTTAGSDEKLTAIGKRIHNSMAVVQRLLQHKQGEASLPVLHAQRAITFNRSAPEAKAKAKAAAKNANRPKALQVEIFHREWTKPYKTWRKRLEGLKEPPYAAQWIFMNAVHKRCTEEAEEERRGTLKKIQIPDSEPARLLCHGLPGSGKTQVMKWLAQYFQEVWSWEQGVHFVYLAPMNSMAARINGSTVHSWGEVPWAMDGPSGTMTMASGSTDLRDMSSMSTKMELCRWMFIDEVEAVGAEILGILEQHTAEAARKRLYQFRGGRARPEDLRPFGGLNTGLFGDFWQMPPVRQINIRSNPFRDRSTLSHQARKMLTFFWGQDPLNSFTQPPIELSVCIGGSRINGTAA